MAIQKTTITHALIDPSADPVQRGGTIQLGGFVGGRWRPIQGISVDGQIITSETVDADAQGEWTVSLIPNDDITSPLNTLYRYLPAYGDPVVFLVPQGGGSHTLLDVLVNDPGNWPGLQPTLTGPAGPANSLSIGTVTPGSPPDATITGTPPNQVLNLTLEKGDAATVDVDSTVTGDVGTLADVTNTGDTHDAKFKFTIPQGRDVVIGGTTTVDVGALADVKDTGSTTNQLKLNFEVPRGRDVIVGSTSTGAAGTSAAVSTSGSTTNQLKLDFTIPRGNKGDAATVAVHSTVTGAAGTSASVTNEGTSSAAAFKFTIPRGEKGINWKGAWSSATAYVVGDAVEYNGSSYWCSTTRSATATTPPNDTAHWDLLAQRGVDGSGSVVTVNSKSHDGSGNVVLNNTDVGAAATSHTHTASQISDSTATGRGVLTAASQSAARTAIGAGTSDLALGTTSSTAMPGNTVANDIGGVDFVGLTDVKHIWSGTQAQYDGLPSTDPNTLYIVV